MNLDVGVYQTTPDNDGILLNWPAVPKLSLTGIWVCWTSCDPNLTQRMLNMRKMLIVWKIFGSRLLSSCSVSAFYSFSSAYAALQTDKFEKLQLRFRLLIASAQPIFWPLAQSKPLFGPRPNIMSIIAYFTSKRCKVCYADESRGTRWDNQTEKRSHHLQPRC